MQRARTIMKEEHRELLTLGFAILVFMFGVLALNLRDYGTRISPDLRISGAPAESTPRTDSQRLAMPVSLTMRAR